MVIDSGLDIRKIDYRRAILVVWFSRKKMGLVRGLVFLVFVVSCNALLIPNEEAGTCGYAVCCGSFSQIL